MTDRRKDEKRPSVPFLSPGPGIKRIENVYEIERCHNQFFALFKKTFIRYRDVSCLSWMWPQGDVSVRAIPESIVPLGEEEGYDHAANLKRFFDKFSPSGIVAWPEAAPHWGTFEGRYNDKTCQWFEANFHVGYICCISKDSKIGLVADRDMRFSVVACEEEKAEYLDEVFGGGKALKNTFIEFLESGDFGNGPGDKEWAMRHIVDNCDW